MEESNPELEAFRQRWKEEVSARTQESTKQTPAKSSKASRKPAAPRFPTTQSAKLMEELEDDLEPQSVPEIDAHRPPNNDFSEVVKETNEPQSALEHYERAVERENEGSLGDSLNLYRKAFRMDHNVEQKYKNKHFPPSSLPPKATNPNPSNASVTFPNTAHHSLDGPPQSIKDLIAGFSGLSIEPAPPIIEGTPAPPCPVAELPGEIMVHILTELAIMDVASFVRLAQVCKKLAFLVLTEVHIWKRICEGSEVGFGGMHYQWQREVMGEALKDDISYLQDPDSGEPELLPPPLSKEEVTDALLHTAYRSSWQRMFRLRPRVRFNGCYISTVNYIRPGQASANQLTWQSPVHIVTYFRYLRFFRDGTVISLLTTDEPTNVVHHLTKELQTTHRDGAAMHLPSAVMQHSLRGRWRLSNPLDHPSSTLIEDAEGDIFVETEGATKKYMYRMKLSFRSSGKGAKNNKLTWRGFWNYNLLTDDTGEFTLRNDKAFFFSRVRSYGVGA